MNTLALVLVLAVASTQGGLVKRSDDASPPSLQDIVSQAETHMQNFASTMQSLFTPGDEQKQAMARVSQTLNNQTQQLATQVQTLVDNLNKAAQEGGSNTALKEVADRLNGTLRTLLGQETADSAQRASEELSTNVKNAVQTVVEEASKVSKNIETETAPLREELGAATRSAIAQALDVADYLQQQFQQAVSNAAAPAPAAAA